MYYFQYYESEWGLDLTLYYTPLYNTVFFWSHKIDLCVKQTKILIIIIN